MSMDHWIWTELMAFDAAQEDAGVAEYLGTVGFVPYGISLLLSSVDFVLLYAPAEPEAELFPDICSRFGHSGNETRKRQKWTVGKLRLLIQGLQSCGVKVFFSVFPSYLKDRFHPEWGTSHPETLICYECGVTAGLNVLARLNDGSLLEDLFVARLEQVVHDYGFDGFHGADGFGPAGFLGDSDCSDAFFGYFIEERKLILPAGIEAITGNVPEKLKTRLAYLYSSEIRPLWIGFHVEKWTQFWRKIAGTMHKLGRETMINSPWTHSAAEAILYSGIDYRRIAKAGVDFMMVECVAGNIALLYGGEDRHFDLNATLLELKAFVPGMKLVCMHGVKDVVESYDLLRHQPARLSREVFSLANSYVLQPDSTLRRASEGMMACLGDGLEAHEWRSLKECYDTSSSFDPVSAGELIWLFSPDSVDPLVDELQKNGRIPDFMLVGELTGKFGFQISVIADIQNLPAVKTPCIIPNFDLLPIGIRAELLADLTRPMILWGNFCGIELPDGASGVFCEPVPGFLYGCVVLNSMLSPGSEHISCEPVPFTFDVGKCPRRLVQKTPVFPVPDAFMNAAAALMRTALNAFVPGPCGKIRNPETGIRLLEMSGKDGSLLAALYSIIPHYCTPEYFPPSMLLHAEKSGSFPYGTLVLRDGKVACEDCPLHLPPYGVSIIRFYA